MIPATEGVLRLQMKSKSSMPCTARGCKPLSPQRQKLPNLVPVGRDALLDEASSLVMEKSVLSARAEWSAGSYEATDVVVCGSSHSVI